MCVCGCMHALTHIHILFFPRGGRGKRRSEVDDQMRESVDVCVSRKVKKREMATKQTSKKEEGGLSLCVCFCECVCMGKHKKKQQTNKMSIHTHTQARALSFIIKTGRFLSPSFPHHLSAGLSFHRSSAQK